MEIASDKNKCKTAIDGLVKDVEGTSLKEDFNTLATYPNLIDEVVENIQNNFAISLSNPDISTTAKTYKIGQYSVTFYIDVEKVGDYYQINGKQYAPLYYAGSKGFIGFYDKDILATITPNEKGEYPKGVLDSKGAWLLPSATTYKVESYQTLVETTIPTLQSDFLEPFATYWKALHKCTDTEFKAYEEGIVPECFWHGVGNPNFAQLAGLIDETYRTGVGFGKFTKPFNKIDDLLREYLLGITCEDELWNNIKKIDKLEDEIRKLNYDAEIINFVVEQWKNEQIETLAEDIAACDEYVNFKQKLPQFADIVLNWDTWARTFENLPDNIDKYVETFAKDLDNVGTLNDLQNYALGKRMFEVGSIFATAGGANAAERGINVLKSLPKLPNGLALKIEETIGEVGIKVFIEGETEVFFSIGKGGVYTSSRWYTGSNVTTVLEELTNIHYIDAAGTSKTGTVQIIQDAAGNKWFKVAGVVSRYANYPNIQKLATHILDELDGLLWDDAILSTLEADLGKSSLKQALEGDLDLLYLWKTSNQTTLVNLTLLKNQLQKIGYSDFKAIDFLKNADGTYYGNKLIYADPYVTADNIIKGSPDELSFLEAICNKYTTKAYTPVSTKQEAVDGILAIDSKFIQLKTATGNNMMRNINSAYNSAKNAGIKNVDLYVEITDQTTSEAISNWAYRLGNPANVKIGNDGTISKITIKSADGWVDLDLNLIK